MKNENEILEGLEKYLEKRQNDCVAHYAKIIAMKMEFGDENFNVPYFEIRIQVYKEILDIINNAKKT